MYLTVGNITLVLREPICIKVLYSYLFSELQLIELKSEEHRLQRQVDVIKKALFEIGCEELPSGCDLPPLDINDIDITVSEYSRLGSNTFLFSIIFFTLLGIRLIMYYMFRLMVL